VRRLRAPLRALATAAVLPAVVLGAVGCTGAGNGPAVSGSPSAPAGSPTTPPVLAGSSEARALAPLPEGPATGTTVLSYSGVGEVRSAFSGECSHDGDSTRIDGSADTARIRLDVSRDGARLALDDVGFSATSDLGTGRYEVSGPHLSLAAPLAKDGQVVGSVELEVDCGR
jgi:hypothetical protein